MTFTRAAKTLASTKSLSILKHQSDVDKLLHFHYSLTGAK